MERRRGTWSKIGSVAAALWLAVCLGTASASATVLESYRSIEVPGLGATFSVPMDWRIYSMPAMLGRPASPASPLRSSVALNVESPSRADHCSLFAYTGRPGIRVAFAEEVAGWYESWVLGDVRSGAISPQLERITLPCGEGFHAYWTYDGGARGARYGHVYHFVDADVLYRLACWSNQPRTDAWRSLVTTLRFSTQENGER